MVHFPDWTSSKDHMIPHGAMLVSVIYAAVPGHDKTGDPCRNMWSIPLTEALVMALGSAALGVHVDMSGVSCHLKPC